MLPVTGAGTVGPAWTEGGLRQARPGSARRYSAQGGSQARPGVRGLAEPGFLASSLGRGGHDRGTLDLVVADLADVELLEVLAELLEGLLERRQRLARARERGRAREQVVLHVGMVDPALLDLGDGDRERRLGGAHHVGPLRPSLDALRHALLQELVDPAQDRRERAAREPLVLLIEEAQGDEVRRLELRGPLLFRGVRLVLHEGAVHPDDLERLLLEVVRLLDVEG